MTETEKIWRVEWTYCVFAGTKYKHHRDYKTERGANKKKIDCENGGFRTEMFEIVKVTEENNVVYVEGEY